MIDSYRIYNMRDYNIIKIEKDDLAKYYNIEHKSIKMIARIYGCASCTIKSRSFTEQCLNELEVHL